ncbi:hypothetical protein CH63R_13830 [Colletotrichum higginsianum IMI 349063]|uniref:Uncharacterized protein n=1 Tax=Colletotrichum higginsianum (strain IMI 349063) TaxID=759273 RepID=A0A1B7XSA1_COLHI|nr:hypothetical protein CH63R_13830 [Colletotrichum higginsianum IMI 349063]OBR02604.1 hypothetical protein CH63R_13830 [Colletotrichum higginsianum IMI 349063]
MLSPRPPPLTCWNIDRHLDHLQRKPDHGHHLLHSAYRHGAPTRHLPRCSPDRRHQAIHRPEASPRWPPEAQQRRNQPRQLRRRHCLQPDAGRAPRPAVRQRSASRWHASHGLEHLLVLVHLDLDLIHEHLPHRHHHHDVDHHDIHQHRLSGFDDPVRTRTVDNFRLTKSWTVLPRRRRRSRQCSL